MLCLIAIHYVEYLYISYIDRLCISQMYFLHSKQILILNHISLIGSIRNVQEWKGQMTQVLLNCSEALPINVIE